MGRFVKGQSGNPGGRPKTELAVRELARAHTEVAIKTLVKALKAKTESVRVSAAEALLSRGWGKPPQPVGGSDDLPPIKTTFEWLTAPSKE